MPKLEGSVENIVFRNEENQYTVARFRLNDSGRLFRDDLATIVGILPGIHSGELLVVEGEWEHDPKYGRQLHVASFIERLPASPEGIVRYLSSGLIKGIGPKKAKLIVDHFGEQTLAIIEQQPERLSEVKGISAKERTHISTAWAEQSEIKELHLFLQSHDVSMNVATKVYKQYGKDAIKVVRENPYQLAQDVHGIGFRTADDIAVKLGLPLDSVPRLATGLTYVLAQAANDDGHCFLYHDDLLRRSAHALQTSPDTLPIALEQLKEQREIYVEPPFATPTPPHNAVSQQEIADIPSDEWSDEEERTPQERVYYAPFWYAESRSVRLLRQLMHTPSVLPPTTQQQWDLVFSVLKEKRNMVLTERQQAAVQMAYNKKVS